MAPVDGKVVVIEEVFEAEYFKDNRLQVSIFMSPINVHVTRYAVSGKIKYSKYLFNTVIPNTSLLNESTFYGKPLCLFKIDSEGAIAYLNLASEILKNNIKIEKELI